MKRALFISLLLIIGIGLSECKKQSQNDYNKKASDPELLHAASEHLIDEIVWDIFKPPVASRILAYSYIAAYEVLSVENNEHKSLVGKINGLTPIPKPDKNQTYCFPLASMVAFNTVGKTLTLTNPKWDTYEKEFYERYEEMDIPEDVSQRSVEYGKQVAKHILNYASEDNYKTTRDHRHTLTHMQGSWEPTPPNYSQACEPKWSKIRTFTLDSISQFIPPNPIPFDTSVNSSFYKLTREVYDTGINLTEEQKAIAYFWDDNPTVTNAIGHITTTERKMSPPAHWIAIAKTLSRDKKFDLMKAIEVYTLTSIALYDAFIVCWDVKYKSDRIRPVTVIHKYIDQSWMPYLETPPFPEYVSGHSSISASAGKVLIHVFGNEVSFTDSTEYKFGHGVRAFKSLDQAYWEASYSRVYGGIHYRDGVEEGTRLGEEVGEWVWKKIMSGTK